KPLIAGASPGSLHFVCYKQAAMLARDLHGAFEVARRWHDETANAKNRLCHEGGNLAGSRCHDQLFDIVCAGETAFRVRKFEGAAVAIRRWRMNKAGDLRRQ